MEVHKACKMMKHDVLNNSCAVHKLPEKAIASCEKKQNHSNLILSQQCELVNGEQQEQEASAKGVSKVCQTLHDDRVIKLSLSGHIVEPKNSLQSCENDFDVFIGSLNDAAITPASAEFSGLQHGYFKGFCQWDENSSSGERKSSNPVSKSPEQVTMFVDEESEPRDGCLASNRNVHEQAFPESIREMEFFFSKLVINEPMCLPNIRSKNNFLGLLHPFAHKPPVHHSRKKLLVLDVNGLLADIVYPPPKGYQADTKIAGRAIFKRPSCSDFLNFCFEQFDVGVWSSRSKRIVDRVVHYLMGDMKQKLIFCWDLSHCTKSNFRTLENRHKALVFKELRKIWEKYDPDLPWENGDYNESNTLLLDDSPYKALLNPPHTAIFPYSYDFKDQTDNSIGPGGNIRAYLEELAMAENVQEYIKKHPFGQSAITERSLSWSFYNKVIKRQDAVSAA
ncbi:hypothetical protein Ancab_018332 [Ancistrocladus abbreviatus]